jgi:Zn-dependent protease with chaperone function
MELVYKNEKTLFVIALVISSLVWAGFIAVTLGLILLWLPIGFLFYVFAHSAFISYLKGTAIKVSETQYPDIYQRLVECCRTVGVETVPECYVLRTDTFNALATKFLGRNYVVLFSDAIDALASKPDALNFYIGHELGHIHRKHLNWSFVLAPAKLLPLLGAAYSRACESTCDRYGFACCQQAPDAAVAGLVAIGSSDTRYLSTDTRAYIAQAQETRGFWMSFHELTGGYPWLVKRVAAVQALAEGQEVKHPRRNVFAWIVACFIPNIGIGGAGVIVFVAIIGIVAAVAIPAYRSFQEIGLLGDLSSLSDSNYGDLEADGNESSQQEQADLSAEEVLLLTDMAVMQATPYQAAVEGYAAQHNAFPMSGDQLGNSLPEQPDSNGAYVITIGDAGTIEITMQHPSISGSTVYLTPALENGAVQWSCASPDLIDEALPEACRG